MGRTRVAVGVAVVATTTAVEVAMVRCHRRGGSRQRLQSLPAVMTPHHPPNGAGARIKQAQGGVMMVMEPHRIPVNRIVEHLERHPKRVAAPKWEVLQVK